MPIEIFLALMVFAFTTSITPGPNNMMLFASGVNFGFVRTIPHMCGIGVGFLVLLLAVGFGLGALLETFPVIYTVMKFAGGAYLLWIAWKIATSRSIAEGKAGARPMSFLDAAAFQWVNPKAWVLALTSIAVYASPQAPFLTAGLVVLVFVSLIPPCVALWTAFGTALRTWLSDPVRLKWFNIAMGVALAATLWPMLS